jgi:tetratricopeptide (TPR) repeat protein|tara:strand:- start:28 stop:954 length:927 start_codon:yes stop_codon:yes gene_type:complete
MKTLDFSEIGENMKWIVRLAFQALLCSFLTISNVSAQGHMDLGKEPTLKQKAEIYLYKNEFTNSIDMFSQAIEKDNSDHYLYRGIAQAYNRSGKIDEGVDAFNKFLQFSPSNALYGLGYLHYLIKENEQSVLFLRESIKMNPQNTLAMNNLGAILSENDSFDEALGLVKKAISIAPKEGMFYMNLQLIYSKMGKENTFIEEYEESVKQGLKDVSTGYGKAYATSLRQQGFKSFSEGKPEKSIQQFEKIIEIYRDIKHPGGELAGLFALGLLHEEFGGQNKAFDIYREILKINPDHIQARERLNQNKNN